MNNIRIRWTFIFILLIMAVPLFAGGVDGGSAQLGLSGAFKALTKSTGVYNLQWKQIIMLAVGSFVLYLAIVKKFEPLLLVPIGIGAIFTNIPFPPGKMLMDDGQFIKLIYDAGIQTGIFPLIIFMGVGALTDFGPLLSNPKLILLGAAAQFGIFITLLGAILLGFTLPEASAIGIIGVADGPTAIYTARLLADNLLGEIAIAAYSYMALVPIIQPPIMRLLTGKKERKIRMKQLKPVSKRVKIAFPIVVIIVTALLIPSAAPLVGMLMFGNLLRESGVVDRLFNAAKNEIINITTIFLGICVGAKMQAESFLKLKTLGILSLGLIAFAFGTAAGVIFAKIMNKFSKKNPVNPLIGSAGVSAVPMAARVSQKVGHESDPHNHLLMHAMGPNVAGVIGSAICAGILIALSKGV